MSAARLRWPNLDRSDVLMSFISEKMRSASEVSSGISSMMATRRSTYRYSLVYMVSMWGQSNLNARFRNDRVDRSPAVVLLLRPSLARAPQTRRYMHR